MRFSARSWWNEPGLAERGSDGPRIELSEVMDELDPGWAAWTASAPSATG